MNHTKFARAQLEHKQLLLNLKYIAETFLSCKLKESWICSSALLRLHTSIEQIFTNGIKVFKPDGVSPDIWRFIEGLNWLNPSMTVSIANRSCSPSIHIPYARIKNDKALSWIYESLESHLLSQKLNCLLTDREHVNACYEVTAFFQSEKYVLAFLLCLKAIENNQPNLLTQIDISLYKSEKSQHKRSTSHPDFSFIPKTKPNPKTLFNSTNSSRPPRFSYKKSSADKIDDPSNTRRIKTSKNIQFISLKLRPWASLPDIHDSLLPQRRRSTTMTQPICIPTQNVRSLNTTSIGMQKIPLRTDKQNAGDSVSHNPNGNSLGTPSPNCGESIRIALLKCDDIKIHEDREYRANASRNSNNKTSEESSISSSDEPCKTGNKSLLSFMLHHSDRPESVSSFSGSSAPADFVSAFIPQEGEKIQNRYSKPMADILFERPKQGQSLTSYLRTAQFSRPNIELERENAHFNVSEAMISAIEQIKWRRFLESREHIIPETNAICTNSINRSRSQPPQKNISTMAASVESAKSSSSDDGSVDYSANDTVSSNLNQTKDLSSSTQSISDHKAYAEWGESVDTLSAESVALTLISKFNDKQLPKASDLMWLVSEQDAPQQLLPMPGSWTVNPDEIYKIPVTRGTRDWAPPRAQIIFTRHPQPDRKKLLYKQNQRCAGCGMKVAAAFSHRFRYCEYIGKYHCSGCHRNQISVIPARVLDRWDFSLHPVSVFSYRLLDQIWTFPVFRVSDLSAELYEKVRILRIAKIRRVHLKFVRDFITICRFADDSRSLFDGIETYITHETDLWSMTDFVAVRNGSFTKNISTIIAKCDEHIKECELCTARGFICELCPQKQVIFPWQPKIKRCNDCGACYHEHCLQNECNKCQRLKKRQQSSGGRKI